MRCERCDSAWGSRRRSAQQLIQILGYEGVKLRRRNTRFYLREFPGQLNETFDPRKFPPSKYNARAYLDTALPAVVDELDPGMVPRLKFPNWGSNASDDADALFWEEGYLIDDQASGSENINKCAFLRIQPISGD